MSSDKHSPMRRDERERKRSIDWGAFWDRVHYNLRART